MKDSLIYARRQLQALVRQHTRHWSLAAGVMRTGKAVRVSLDMALPSQDRRPYPHHYEGYDNHGDTAANVLLCERYDPDDYPHERE